MRNDMMTIIAVVHERKAFSQSNDGNSRLISVLEEHFTGQSVEFMPCTAAE